MSFRRRLTLLTAGAVALAIALASIVTYVLVRNELRDQLDETLIDRGRAATVGPRGDLRGGPGGGQALRLPPGRPGGPEVLGQLVAESGAVLASQGSSTQLPVTATTTEIAAGRRGPTFSDVTVDGVSMRVLTLPVAPATALQLARPLTEVDNTLEQLLVILALVVAGGTALAAVLGLAVTRTALAPVARMTETAEDVARTQDLGRRIELSGEDELGRLATSFNQMLAALERSVGAQRRLVADASHELRTPLTSLRTNAETLERVAELSTEERSLLLGDVESELEELTRLVDDIVDLAREGSERRQSFSEVRLDELVAGAVERARRRSREIEFTLDLEPVVVRGDRERLDRAVSNILDNAIKWSPESATVEVRVDDGALTVRDHGPGIAAEDLPHVFDRFYRAPAARGMPGSGLGLAIAKQVAEMHDGTIAAENADGGGARLELRLPHS
jgi:two-component system sensor histidine kinase MprB